MTDLDEGLNGLRVLLTGGSRGPGAATARRFAAAGAIAVTAARTAPPAGPNGRPGPGFRVDGGIPAV